MNRFPSTLLPQTNDPKEIQKGMLDLLSKINKVGTPSTGGVGAIKSVAVDYTFEPGDGVTDLFVTTGAATIIVTLARSSSNPGRLVRVWKADDGAGEVRVIGRTTGSTTETISGYASVYVGYRYQHADIYQDGTTNFNVGQYIQPVAGEPSLGTYHALPSPSAYNAVNGGSATAFTDADVSALVPAGTKAVKVFIICHFVGTAAQSYNFVLLRKNGTAVDTDQCPQVGMLVNPAINGTTYQVRGMEIVEVDASRIFEYRNNQTGTSSRLSFITVIGYFL